MNKNGPEGAGLEDSGVPPFSSIFLGGVPFSTPMSPVVEEDDDCSYERDETLVFRRKYPPSVRVTALGTLHPLNLPLLKLGNLPVVLLGLPISVTVLVTFPVDVALNGIFLFFLFFKLKSSLPTLETVDPESSASSSESEDSKSPCVVIYAGEFRFDVGEYVCEKICGAGGGRDVPDSIIEEDVVAGTRRLGRGRIGRVLIREAGKEE